MRIGFALACALLLTAPLAFAAPTPYLNVDHSTDYLMDAATAQKMWAESVSSRARKLYPPNRWGFASEVSGGINHANICVITARAMLLPRSGKTLVFKPELMTIAYDALPNSSMGQCKELSRQKMHEAIQALLAAVVPG